MSQIKLEVSVTDVEPISELIEIITSQPLDDLPEPLRTNLKEWYEKHYSDGDE